MVNKRLSVIKMKIRFVCATTVLCLSGNIVLSLCDTHSRCVHSGKYQKVGIHSASTLQSKARLVYTILWQYTEKQEEQLTAGKHLIVNSYETEPGSPRKTKQLLHLLS